MVYFATHRDIYIYYYRTLNIIFTQKLSLISTETIGPRGFPPFYVPTPSLSKSHPTLLTNMLTS
jgi:hypothetical protein